MRQSFINHVLQQADKHENVHSAILARGDKGVSFMHLAHRYSGTQNLLRFANRQEARIIQTEPFVIESTMFLGYYTVSEAVWDLASTADKYEQALIAHHQLEGNSLMTFPETIMAKLILSSEVISPEGDIQEGHELWKLCLSGNGQEPYVPGNESSGNFLLIPGKILAEFSAPKGLASAVQIFLAKEKEVELLRVEEAENVDKAFSELLAHLGFGGFENGDDPESGQASNDQ